MEDIFKRKASEIRVEPSSSTWGKLDTHLELRQMVRERNRYRASLSIAASIALISMVFNALYISNFTNSDYNSSYTVSSSLMTVESGEPFHMSTKNLKTEEAEIELVGRIQVKQN